MKIKRLILKTNDAVSMALFYGNHLGWPVRIDDGGYVEVEVGNSVLVFEEDRYMGVPHYKIAFNVAPRHFDLACQWVRSKKTLLHDSDGNETFWYEPFGAESIYLKDPAGTILEWTAREGLRDVIPLGGVPYMFGIGGAGLVVKDIRGVADQFTSELGVSEIALPDSSNVALGDAWGILHLEKEGSLWLPDNTLAEAFPMKIFLEGKTEKTVQINDHPYRIFVEVPE